MATTLPARRSSALQTLFGADPFLAMRQELDDVFNRFTSSGNGGVASGGFRPALDLSESGDALYVSLDLPGVAAGDLDIEVQDDQLLIRGERKPVDVEKERSFHIVERSSGAFSRTLPLPCAVQADKVEAAFHEGVLTITLPKSNEAKTRKVTIKTV